ncbi:MAG: biotin--[Bacteroidaceae bacterium]|nr:biotin--[acetyl-CoA-carboxylase] ligase [Bacteroidaceae bacterium]
MSPISRINLPRVDSTNNFIRDMLSFGDELNGMTLVVAEAQTAGRGQTGNHWESEPGQNLTFSLLCHPDFVLASEQFILSQCIALSVWNTLEELVPKDTILTIKWPNDIYVDDRKICGTLIECDLQGKHISNCIIGTGLNVNQTTFLSDAPNPVSLKQLTGNEHDREAILSSIIAHFQNLYEQVRDGHSADIRQEYMQRLYRREGFHAYRDVRGEFLAEIADIEPTGHLLLRFENGNVCRYEFKEVKFINL